MRIKAARAIIGDCSDPSKMPSYSYSLPNSACGVGSKLAAIEGTICSHCYAGKGTYRFKSTVDAMNRRLGIVREAIASEEKREQWVSAFSTLLNKRATATRKAIERNGKVPRRDNRVFRWHDSGDLQGRVHLGMILAVAERCPSVSFWLPTKEAGLILSFLLDGGVIPTNLTVKLSVPRIGDAIPSGYLRIARLSNRVTFAGAHEGEAPAGMIECPAYRNNGECGTCRNCWDAGIDVSYPVH